jgi:micrococcal nuclease
MNHRRNYNKKRMLLFIGLVLATCACLHEQAEGLLCVSVYDGDTFELENGEVVRLIGIDSPEHFEPGGDIARDYLSSLILNKKVILVPGDQELDAYNRLLRYVYVDGICVNEEMIRKGYAEVRYIGEDNPNREYYLELEIEAEKNEVGLWRCKIFQPRSLVDWNSDIPVINWKDADQYYGQYVIVEGTIVDTYNSGDACFLNFHPDWASYFTVVIFACDFPEFSDRPEIYYLDRMVQVIGIIKEYKGSPEIIVKTPAQIRIVN